MGKPKTICTHDDDFHCAEVLACYMLKQISDYKDAKIVRTSDPKLIGAADVAVNVGNVYDRKTCRYDYTGGENLNRLGDFENSKRNLPGCKPFDRIQVSCAGLIYHHYGRQIWRNRLKSADLLDEDDVNQIERFYNILYDKFIQEVDADYNGYAIESDFRNYKIYTDLCARVAGLRPKWTDKNVTSELLDERFKQALELIGREFEERVDYFIKIWFPARKYVKEALRNRREVHPSGKIIDVSSYGFDFPWQDHIVEVEKELNIEGETHFVLSQNVNKDWCISGVPQLDSIYQIRTKLAETWFGCKGQELVEISGNPDYIFVHHNCGYTGGARTREACIEMAMKSIEYWSKIPGRV